MTDRERSEYATARMWERIEWRKEMERFKEAPVEQAPSRCHRCVHHGNEWVCGTCMKNGIDNFEEVAK